MSQLPDFPPELLEEVGLAIEEDPEIEQIAASEQVPDGGHEPPSNGAGARPKKNRVGRPTALRQWDGAKVRQLRGDTKASEFCQWYNISPNTLTQLERDGLASPGIITKVCRGLTRVTGKKITPNDLKTQAVPSEKTDARNLK